MASIILHSVGAAVGNALFPGAGALLGLAGQAAGGLIDQSLGLATHVTGPRLNSLAVQDSRYGAGIPIVYGRARIAGNVIWSTDLIETTHTNRIGGKGGSLGGGASSTSYTYSVHCAMGVAAGPIGGISTIWADSTIIYQNGQWKAGVVDSATIYTGAAGQTPDPLMQSILGSGNVPAYQGLAYVVFDNLQLGNFGNRLPNLTFEITPATATTDPAWLGNVDASVSQHDYTLRCGAMMPITLQGNSAAQVMLLGGYTANGSTCAFEVTSFDVTGNAPVELSRVTSATLPNGSVSDCSWALSPDERFVAMYLRDGEATADHIVLYDTQTASFGTILNLSIGGTASQYNQIAWPDAQHVVVGEINGTVRGVRVLARAGGNLVDLGFKDVWGSGSNTSCKTLFYTQFLPYANGLLALMTDNPGANYTAIYARTLSWQSNALTVGTAYTLAGAPSFGASAVQHVNAVRTGSDEWTLVSSTFVDMQLLSFEPSATSAAITRPWQTITPSGGWSSTQFPIFYGDRLVVVQNATTDNAYHLSDILLNAGSFSLVIDGVEVANTAAIGSTFGFAGVALDQSRILLLGTGSFGWNIGQCAVVRRTPGGLGLDALTADLLNRAGYSAGDYDVSGLASTTVVGYIVQEPMSARSALEPLQAFAPFDLVESDARLKAVMRHGHADLVIPSAERRATTDEKPQPPDMKIARAQELDLPREIITDYMDSARGYEVNSQRARRGLTKAQSTQKINLPIVCDSATAKQVAESRLFALWAEREVRQFTLSRRWLSLDAGDVVDVGNNDLLRVTRIEQANGLVDVEGLTINAAAYESLAATDSATDITSFESRVATQLYLLDAPLLQNADDQPGVYAAATGVAGWNGATLWRAADGVSYAQVASLITPAVAGIAVTALGHGSALYMDSANSLQVQLASGTLASCSATDLLNGANAAWLGGEIVQFQTATLSGPGLYTLTNLLRGRRGTDDKTSGHAAGEDFVLLQSSNVTFVPALLTDRGTAYEFRALSNGQSLGQTLDQTFTYALNTLQPFAPVNIVASRVSGTGSDATITWQRRARLNAEWVNYVDVPLDEPNELYDVEIMNGTSVVRAFLSLAAPTVTYTAAQQSADWGAVPASFTVRVYQIGARYGRGKAGTAVV